MADSRLKDPWSVQCSQFGPDGRTVQPGRGPVTRTRTAAPTNFIPGTNLIEFTFATVRLRAKVTRGAGCRTAALAMTFKLIESAQERWRALNAPHLVVLVRGRSPVRVRRTGRAV
jgi:hypothetical protein